MPQKLTAAQAKATEVATTIDQGKVGFPIAIIISIVAALLPEIIKCFMPSDPASVKKYVENRYGVPDAASSKYGGYTPRLAKTMMNRAKVAAGNLKPRCRLSDEAALEIAVKTLDDIRNGDPVKMTAVIDEYYSS